MNIIDTPEQYAAYCRCRQDFFLPGAHGATIRVPCVNTIVVRRGLVLANAYNPNKMPEQKRQDLVGSIRLAGLAYPVAAWWDDDLCAFVIVDGFHRWLVMGYDYLGLEYVPVVPLDHLTATERMMATWLFNKARGFHQVDLDAELIRTLLEQGMDEAGVAEHLGIELETVHRYKQLTGIAELFKNVQYSMSWGVEV